MDEPWGLIGFLAAAGSFLVLLAFAVWRGWRARRQGPTSDPAPVRFVPHAFLMRALLAAAVGLLATILLCGHP